MCLQNEYNNPVDARNDRIEGKGCWSMVILTPYCVAYVMMSVTVCRLVESIVYSRNNHEEPGYDGEDFVGNEVASSELLTLCEGIV